MSAHNVSEVFGFLPDYLDYCTNDTFSCGDVSSPCQNPRGLVLGNLWTISQNYYNACGSTGAWLIQRASENADQYIALTRQACYDIAGTSYTKYPKADIWSRLTMWKFPLIQLIASSPRPPLGFRVEMLVVLHIVSDPIGCLKDLVWKLECCQSRAVFWKAEVEQIGLASRTVEDEKVQKEELWKALTIITESYDEFGHDYGEAAKNALMRGLGTPRSGTPSEEVSDARERFFAECITTASALSADRATTLLPVIMAEVLFIAVFLIDVIRMKASSQLRTTTTTLYNIEIHSIGFSTLFFWLISLVMVAAIIGASQTQEAIPRILKRFNRDLRRAKINIPLPDLASHKDSMDDRWLHGGIYVWHPLQRDRISAVCRNRDVEVRNLQGQRGILPRLKKGLLRNWPAVYMLWPMTVFAAAILTGMLISGFVPPRGWTCRSWGEIYFAFAWVTSCGLSSLISRLPTKAVFAVMFCKDFMVTGAVAAWIFVTQIGIYNRCDCYMQGDTTGLVLPEQPEAFSELQAGLQVGGSYLTILVVGIVFQVILAPGILCARYGAAIMTFVQKDKSISERSALGDTADHVTQANGKARSFWIPPLDTSYHSLNLEDVSDIQSARASSSSKLTVDGLEVEELELAHLTSQRT